MKLSTYYAYNNPMADPFLNEPVTHAECRCLVDQDGLTMATDASKMADPTCECPCEACVRCRYLHSGIVRRALLELRLEKAGISPEDLADILWHQFFVGGLDRWMRKRVAETLRDKFAKLRFNGIDDELNAD